MKGILYAEGGYRYGHNVPDADVINEWWFSKNRMTFSSRGWAADWGGNLDLTFVYDQGRQRLLAVDSSNRSYVEVVLPMSAATYLEPWMTESLRRTIMDGQATKTGRTATVLGRACEQYEVREWFVRGDDRYYDRTRTILVSTEVPFDYRLFDDVYLWAASFNQPRPGYLARLKEMPGFIMRSEESVYEGGSQVRFAFEVKEMSEAEAPPGTYDLPVDYVQKTKFSRQYVFALQAIMFLYSLY